MKGALEKRRGGGRPAGWPQPPQGAGGLGVKPSELNSISKAGDRAAIPAPL